MRILCCGDRNWTDRQVIRLELAKHRIGTIVIEGGCRGADRMSAEEARRLGMQVEEFPADWTRYGRAAGPIRNQQMLDEGRPDLVLAFHADLDHSRGTADMVRRARKAGVPVRVIGGPQTLLF